MFLTDDKLLSRLKELLTSASRVDLASAWVTEGPALTALLQAAGRARRPCRVRALIGIKGNSTTPDALDALKEVVQLRIVDDVRLFHPKVYLFGQTGGDWLAWVGSANFTGKGFPPSSNVRKLDGNEEVLLETRATREIRDWFDQRWVQAGPHDDRVLDNYRERYRVPEKGWMDERLPDTFDVLEPIAAWQNVHPALRLPPGAFWPAILRTLDEVGGRSERRNVLPEVHETMQEVLRPVDYELHQAHVCNWEQQCDVARTQMIEQGLIASGTWELTDKGKEAVASRVHGAEWLRRRLRVAQG